MIPLSLLHQSAGNLPAPQRREFYWERNTTNTTGEEGSLDGSQPYHRHIRSICIIPYICTSNLQTIDNNLTPYCCQVHKITYTSSQDKKPHSKLNRDKCYAFIIMYALILIKLVSILLLSVFLYVLFYMYYFYICAIFKYIQWRIAKKAAWFFTKVS